MRHKTSSMLYPLLEKLLSLPQQMQQQIQMSEGYRLFKLAAIVSTNDLRNDHAERSMNVEKRI